MNTFRAKAYTVSATIITSSVTLDQANSLLEQLLTLHDVIGGTIESYVSGIGWVIPD